MATETGEGFSPHLRGVTVTTVATIGGILAGLATDVIVTSPTEKTGLFILVGAIVLQFPLYYAIGIDVADFGTKDQLYVAFMTFTTWFVSWGILLTAGS